ncbi:hypothetical protein ACFOHK_17700 [Falsigemmobacter intermedius]|uniref:DnaA N-terminal domain-containing protein n=1 Tax=Falsigemmobacter intermedius TaxID=1553448 RepID=A0A3S3YA99_9RHOB|nr:hypothetical protein [Falsigemmobacter intermedius]RWY40054.1 hypothetical protein EP867_12350 [Falsigemmobacter intermedius]
MQQPRLTGPGAGSDRYDVLTALSVAALGAGGHQQVLLLRLMALITARYNWAQDELSLGQKDMALMWSVDERTVKREIRRLLDAHLLILLRPGVKGRVAVYRLNLRKVAELTEAWWPRVGPDFEARMAGRYAPEGASEDRVVRLDFTPRDQPDLSSPWQRVLTRLREADPARAGAWFDPLVVLSETAPEISLQAPSRFALRYIETHLLSQMKIAMRQELGPGWRLTLTGRQ